MSGMIAFLFSLLAASAVWLVGFGLYLLIRLCIRLTREDDDDA